MHQTWGNPGNPYASALGYRDHIWAVPDDPYGPKGTHFSRKIETQLSFSPLPGLRQSTAGCRFGRFPDLDKPRPNPAVSFPIQPLRLRICGCATSSHQVATIFLLLYIAQ